jgi:hypothetical protein
MARVVGVNHRRFGLFDQIGSSSQIRYNGYY